MDPAPQFLSIPNWEKYQHYRDRRPPWIKFYTNLKDDPDFVIMSDAAKLLLFACWLAASNSRSGVIPNDLRYIKRWLYIAGPKQRHLHELVRCGFLAPVPDDTVETWKEFESEWSDCRRVRPRMRAEVMAITGGRCAACGGRDRIHIDHIIPIVSGGLTRFENLQPLCWNCHKKKGLGETNYIGKSKFLLASRYQNATPEKEIEKEVEKEQETIQPPKVPRTPTPRPAFVPPSLEQVAERMEEVGIEEPWKQAEAFMGHYESNGWMVGKNKMKSWRGAIQTWKHSPYRNGGNGNGNGKLYGQARSDANRAAFAEALRRAEERDAQASLRTQ